MPLSKPVESLDMIQRFIYDKPLGLAVPVVIPSALPPQAALSDDGGRHLLASLRESVDQKVRNESHSLDSDGSKEDTLANEQSIRRYCTSEEHLSGRHSVLRGKQVAPPCRVSLGFDLGPMLASTALLTGSAAYLMSLTEVIRAELIVILNLLGGGGQVTVEITRLEPVANSKDDDAPMLIGPSNVYLRIEAVIAGDFSTVERVTQLMTSESGSERTGLDKKDKWMGRWAGVLLRQEIVTNVQIVKTG